MNIRTNKKLFRTYQKYLGRRLYLVFVLTLMAAFAESFGIALLLPLIEIADAGQADYDSVVSRAINSILEIFGADGSIGAILVFISVVFIGKGLLKFAEGSYKGYLGAQLLRELKAKMYDAYNAMDYRDV